MAKAYKNIMRKLEFNSLHGKSNRDVYGEVRRVTGDGEVRIVFKQILIPKCIKKLRLYVSYVNFECFRQK